VVKIERIVPWEKTMQKITPFLWFDKNAEEAISFYTSVFPDSHLASLARYPDRELDIPGGGIPGKIMNATFTLNGLRFMALDGGPSFAFNPSVSFFVNATSKDRVDSLWAQLSDGGQALMQLGEYPFSRWYGWIQDRYGLTWQLILTEGPVEQEIVPSLMFTGPQSGRAEEAIGFYVGLFDDSAVGEISRYGPDQVTEEGNVAHGRFSLAGQQFVAMDSGLDHDFTFNEAISLYVECDDQQEVDYFWRQLSSVPDAEQCGWLKDPFGVSWQIIPRQLGELMGDPDPEKAGRVVDAMLKMKKIDVAGLQQAYDGG
jgi:predicted 3-demethylubiquinone-9 3-methyltransferase (glyoxalase superfamily)